jgi:hypothetical protein
MKKILVSESTPRKENEVNQFPFGKGIKIQYFLGYLGICGFTLSILGSGYILYKFRHPEFYAKIILGEIIFCALWTPFILFFLAIKKYDRLRREAVYKGEIIKGKILEKRPMMKIFLVKIEITKPDKTTETIDYKIANIFLYNELNINSFYYGFWNKENNFYLFPFEMGIEIEPNN